ncbi:MAG: glutamate formimidoyltransferase [Chloroflexi bacterium]|nr:glutamate formimidoyltransferase [Chloroflexota bacterium]
MLRIVECVPNFSEGRRKEVVDQIVAAITAVPGVVVLDVELDQDHNRSVVTMAGEPGAVEEAAFQATKTAAGLIDLDQHKGEHPRIGATDVIPFIPLQGITVEECIEIARRLGERIARELYIPVYLYEKAATRPEREDLAYIRRGEYEGLKEEIATNPDREPDFGPRELGKAGATVVGVREPLIAYNVYLGTTDLEIAKAVAQAVRNSSGGLRFVKALGMEISQRNLVQVSMNLTNFRKTPIHRAFELVKREAERYGVTVVSSEIVGLLPEEALLEAAAFYLRLENFSPGQVLEQRLAEGMETAGIATLPGEKKKEGLEEFLEQVASAQPVPGGGSVAALSAALAASLVSMVLQITLPKIEDETLKREIEENLAEAKSLRQELSGLIAEDANAFQAVLTAYRMPAGDEREEAVQMALRGAATVPLTVAAKAVRTMELALLAAQKGSPRLASDAVSAGYMGQAAVSGASANVLVNVSSLSDERLAQAFRMQLEALQNRLGALMGEIEGAVAENLAPEKR